MKKLLSLLLALAMVFSVVPFAFAEEAEDPTPSYDMAYAYTLEPGKTFQGGEAGLISDYDGGLTPDRDQHINSGTTPVADMADLFGIGYWWTDSSSDGFYGNILLKSTEGAILFAMKVVKKNIKASASAKFGYLFMNKAFKNIKADLNYNNYGGSPFLGIRKLVIKSHGSSDALAIFRSIENIVKMHSTNFITTIEESLSKEIVE